MMVLMGLDIGGAETHVLELSRELKRKGFDIVVVSAGGAYEKELTESGIRCFYAPLNKRDVSLMIRSYNILKDLIIKERPDIVHAHARIPAFLCGLLQNRLHFRFVTTAHWVFRVNPALKHLTNWGNRTIAVSDDIREYLKENYGIADERITNTINGIDTEKFSSSADGSRVIGECGFADASPVIVHVSRLDESRALAAEKLAVIAPRLRERFPKLGIIIAGGGDRYEAIKAKADEANAFADSEYVKLLGPRTDISEIVAAGDVFVGVSRAVLEAMAEEKPCVVAGNEGYIGIFGEDKLDISFKTNFCARECPAVTEDVLFDDICSLLEKSDEEKKVLGSYGRDIILENYSVSKMAADYESVYRKEFAENTNILVSGYYGHRNLGDDTILVNIRNEVRKINPDAGITVFSASPEESTAKLGINAVNRFNPFKILKEIKNCHLFISGGGSLLQDNTSRRSLMYYTWLIRLAERYGKKIVFYANGIGPVNQAKSIEVVRRVCDAADAISLRDADSFEALRKMNVKNENIILASDCVYAMERGDRDAGRQLLKAAGLTGERPIVGISVRPVKGVAADNMQFAAFADMIADAGYDPVFIIMQSTADEEAADAVIAAMKNKAYKIASPYEPYVMMGAISLMDTVVSTRLHSTIFAAHEQVPVLGIVYDPKVEACLKAIGMPSAGNYESFDAERAFEQFRRLEDDRAEYIRKIEETSSQLCEAAKLNNEMLTSFI